MRNVGTIFRREFSGYFATPLAYVFIVIYLMLAGILTMYPGGFFERGQADLQAFFMWHPWLYLFLVPAMGMRLWAEERKTGTIELLLTLPVGTFEVVLGKFLAAWGVLALCLILTFPMWIAVNILGDPDNGVILAAYIGSLLMAGGYLAISSALSALTKNQVIAFVASIAASFGFLFSGFPMVIDFFRGWLPQFLIDLLTSLSFLVRFTDIQKGVIDLRDLIYFISLIALWLVISARVIEQKKAD